MRQCEVINKKTRKMCGALPTKLVSGVWMCSRHFNQWGRGKTLTTKYKGRTRKSL